MTTIQTDKSMAALADILRQHGIKIIECNETDSTISFRGGDIVGDKTARLAIQHGYLVDCTMRCYRYSSGKMSIPFWMIKLNI